MSTASVHKQNALRHNHRARFPDVVVTEPLHEAAIQIQGVIGPRINCGLNRVRFPSPVLAESQICARASVRSVKVLGNVTEVIFSIIMECREAAKSCCVVEWIVRYYP